MIINKLVLHNFGIYASTNEFVFKAKKPVVLVGGMNGRGKTTFLEAVLLALYGTNSFAYTESRYRSYGQYLRSYINNSDGTLRSFVDIEFSMDKTGSENYYVHREWDAKSVKSQESLKVYKNGEFNQFLTDNWAMFMENILPSGLSSFFFFDGEKIAELAVENTNNQMKESIKSLLGISVLDLLESDIGRIIVKIAKQDSGHSDVTELEALRRKKEDSDSMLSEIDANIEWLDNKLYEVEQEYEKAVQEYSAKGGDIVVQQQELFQKRSQLASKIEQEKEVLINDAASELPFALVRNLLTNVRENAEIEHEEKVMYQAIEKLNKQFNKFARIQNENVVGAKAFINFLESQTNNTSVQGIYNLSDMTLFQLQYLLDEKLVKTKIEVQSRQNDLQRDKEEAAQLDSYLSVDIDEKALNKLYKKLKKLELNRAEIEVKIGEAIRQRQGINGENIAVNSEFGKKVESYLRKVETSDDEDRVYKYANIAITILNEYKIRLQKRKTIAVAETMTECYKKLANKKHLIESIKMDPITLDLLYLNASGDEVPKSSLSAGEKQLMVISMLWALAICSKKKLPVIIDTPLSRLDSSHRKSLIDTYFPQASDQTIILSTDSEIDQKYYRLMKSNVGDEYTLHYDEESKSTTIKKGYFSYDS